MRLGCDGAPRKCRDALKTFESYEISHLLCSGKMCILDLGDVPSGLSNQEALNELYKYVGELYN